MDTPILRPYCKAKSKRSGRRCRRKVTLDGEVCSMHGRDGGRPIVHGKDSNLPERIARLKLAASDDPRLLDLADGVALLDGLMQSQMERLGAGDSVEWRKRVSDLVDQMKAGFSAGDATAGLQGLRALDELVRAGCDSDRAEAALFAMREKVSARVEELHRIRLAKGFAVNARDLVKLQTIQMVELRRQMDLAGIAIDVQRRIVRAWLEVATRWDDAPPDFRAEMNVETLEVAGGRT